MPKKLLATFLCASMFATVIPGYAGAATERNQAYESAGKATNSRIKTNTHSVGSSDELYSTAEYCSEILSSGDPYSFNDTILNSTGTPELSIDSVTIDKERVRVGETLEITASGAGNCIFLADVYLNNRKLERITGTGGLAFAPEEAGVYSFALEIRKSDTQSAYFFLDHAVVVSEYWELLAVSVNAEEAATGNTIVFSAVMSQEAGTQNPEGNGSALQYNYAVYKDGDLYKEVFGSADDSLSMYLTEPGIYYCVCSAVDEYGTESTATSPTVTLATETQLNENYNTPTHSNTLPVESLAGSSASDLRVAPGEVTIRWTRQTNDSYYLIRVMCSALDFLMEENNYTETTYTIPASDISSGYEYKVSLYRYDSSGKRLSLTSFRFSVTGVESLAFEDSPQFLVPKKVQGEEAYVKYDDLTVQWAKMNYASSIELRLKYSCGINMHEVLLTTVDGKNDTYTIPKSVLVNGAYHELRLKASDDLGNTSSKTVYFYVGEEGTVDEFNITATTLTSTFLSDGSELYSVPTYPAYEPIRLNWLDVPSAAYFSVHFFDYDNNNQETTYDHINAPTFVIDPATLVSGHRYEVRVYSHHTAECYERSKDGWFRAPYVGSQRLDPPKLTSMELSTEYDDPTIMTLRPLTLVWEPESAAVSYSVYLTDIEEDYLPDFEETGITATQVTIPQDVIYIDDLYELDITAVDSDGNTATSVFYLKFVSNDLTAPALLTPTLSTDRNDFPICSLSNLPITWTEVADAVGYRFQLFDYYSGDWDKILDVDQLAVAAYSIPKGKLYLGGKFKFRIKAVDAYSNGKWSETYYFRVGAAGYISLSDTEQSVSASAGRKSFFVTSGEGWTASSSDSWLSISEASGAGSQQVTVIYIANTGEFPRTASITFINSDGGTAVYTVTQEGQSAQNSGALRITSPKQGSVLDYAAFRATWKYNYNHAYYQLSLKDTVTGALVHTENNIITSYADIPISALVYGHAYRLTVGVYNAQGNRISEGSVVFAIDGFDTQTFVEAEDQPVVAGSSNPEGNTEICYSGITDGAAVEQDNILVTWENVIDADHYWVALRDMTLYPDSVPSEEAGKVINTRVDLLKMCIIAGQLTPGHDYRLWIAANRSDGSLIDGKNICFSVIPADGVAFRDLSATADGESIRWSGSVSVENDTILAATVSITTPTLPDGSFDTGYFRVTNVNAASFDYASIHSSAVATGGVVACTDENGVAKSLSLELPGEYIVAFHVYTAGGIYHQEQRRVTVGSGETKPVLGSFSHTASVTLGGPVYLSGTISAADGGTLQRVTVKCNNAGGSENTVATVAVGAASLDLSTLSFSTAEFPAIFTGPGTYEFVLYAAADNYTVTDNAITTFTVTVTERSSVLPNVVMLEPIVHNSSTVTLRALVTDTGGGEIVNFGFNIYDREDDGVFFAQYSAWHEDGYFQSVSYNATTGIITAELKDYPPERIAYAQAFAIYYIGEVEYCGFSPDRVYFKTMCGDITIDDSVKYALLGDMRMLIVQGTFSRPGSNTEGETLQIEILNYRMEPLENASWFTTVGTEGCFACCCDMRGQYPGRYYVRIQTVGGEEPIWNTAPFDIAEPLTVELLPISEESITAEAFSITARTPDLKGKSIVDYGFNIYSDPEGVNMIAQYSYRYGDGAQKDVVFNSAASSWSAYVDGLEANTSVYVKGFIVYSQKGQEVTGFSNALTEVRTKLASLYIGIGGVKGKQNNILDPTNVMVNGRIAPTDAILSECRIEVRDQNDTLVINTPFTPTGPDFEKKLSFSNLEDGAYAIRAIGVCSDGRTAYSEAVTVYNGSYRIVPMDFGDPEINGSGIANVYFQVLNRHDKPVAGLQISYHYDNPNTNGATITDENGIFCITTPRITSNHTYTATITSHNGPSLENNVVSFSVHVKKLSYEQEWSGALEVGLTGEVNLGASASIGVAKARADAIKLAGGGTLGRELTITDSYEDGHRTLSLSTSFDVGLKIKTSSGITADVVGDIINIKPLDFGVSGTAAKKSEIGVRLTDYDPYNLDQVMTVGKLCLIGPLTTLSVFNNSLLNELNMLMLNISGGDTEKNSVLFKVGANVDVGKLTAGASNVEFSGYLLDQSGDIVLDQSASYDSELHEATFSRSVKTTAGIGFMGKPKVKFKNNAVPVGISDSLSAFDSLIGYKRSNSKEVSAVLDCKSYLPLSVSFKTYIGDETDLMYNKDEVNSYVTYKYSAFDLQKVFGQDSDIFKFAKGNNPLINIQKTINELLDSGVKAAYTVTRKIKQGIKLDLPFEASLGIGAELSFELSGEESCSYSSTTGVYYMNKQYDTTVSDVTDRQIIDKKTSLGNLLVEAYTRVLESIKDKVVSTVDNAVSGIRNGMAYVQGMATDFVISITTIPQSHTKSRSVVTLSTKSGGFGNLGISSTIGEPYVVQGFINKSLDEELSDEELSSCQATLTLSYDEEMLAAAGATADSAISIMFFDRDRNVYIQVSSSEQDKEAMQVTAILTRNGEYILVVDTESPEISDFSTSSLGTQQEVMAYVRDMSGISEFRFWIDDSPILVTEDNLDDYYYESTGVFCYTLEEPLSAGIHTAYFVAADSVGNETAEPYAFPFTVTALVGTVESLSCEEEIINGDGPVLVTATVSGGSSITHASLLCTISDITYVLPMSGENGIWQAEFDPIYGGESVHFEVEAGDDFGNCIHAGSLDIPMDLPEKDVLSIRILSASTITNMTHINLRISTGDQPINGYLVFAFYDSRNRMLSAQTDYIAINALSAERFSVSCNPAVSALKVFLLNPETYTPLCPPAACLVHTN